MRLKRWMTGLGAGVLCTAAALVAPGLHAQGHADRAEMQRPAARTHGIGTFTPAAADPKLAAMLARSGLPDSGFRFTPSDLRPGANRAVTVAVRARSARAVSAKFAQFSPATATVNLAPVAYNLGVSVGWKSFAAPADAAKIDLVAPSVGRERFDLGFTPVKRTGNGSSKPIDTNVAAPLVNTPIVTDVPGRSIDLAGKLSVTRNLAVTAGVRVKSEDQRLRRLTADDNRRDSQAVYVGTAFRF